MSNYQIDQTDRKILELLKSNARIQWREIGEEVHLTGQAVGERVKRMVAANVIEGFYTKVNYLDQEKFQISFITIVMTNTKHDAFLELMENTKEVIKVYRISGYGCYMIHVKWKDQLLLDQLLESILAYGNYQINVVLKEYK